MPTQQVWATEARKNWNETLTAAESTPISITRRGNRPDLILVRADFWEKLIEPYEDADDIAAAEASADDLIPWDDVRRDLGLA